MNILSIQQTLNSTVDGYVGIRLSDEQLINDVLFALILVLFILFSIVYRNNFRLFLKMIQDLRAVKERQSLFLQVSSNETVFRNFMTFQTLFLSVIGLFSIARFQGLLGFVMTETTLLFTLFALFVLIFLYYQLKQFMYFITGVIFAVWPRYKLWKSNYNAVIGALGVLLYFPVLWMAYVRSWQEIAVWIFIILFILSRLVIIYKIIRIFYRKSDNLLYFILYLCTQEILPLVFLYEGLVYLYNFIERSTLWH